MIATGLAWSAIVVLFVGIALFFYGVDARHHTVRVVGASVLGFTALLFIVAIWLGVFGL